jgi:hypothetical protein
VQRQPISIFIRDFYLKFIVEKHRQHYWLEKSLGLGWCLTQREDAIKKESCGSVSLVRNYTDRLTMEYNHSAMSTGLGGGSDNIGMEGIVYKVKDGDSVVTHWQGYLGDGKQQDARTSYANTKKFITMLQAKGLLQNGSNLVLYIQSDGCGRQYKLLLQLLSAVCCPQSLE